MTHKRTPLGLCFILSHLATTSPLIFFFHFPEREPGSLDGFFNPSPFFICRSALRMMRMSFAVLGL
jgi:hypothetical protein